MKSLFYITLLAIANLVASYTVAGELKKAQQLGVEIATKFVKSADSSDLINSFGMNYQVKLKKSRHQFRSSTSLTSEGGKLTFDQKWMLWNYKFNQGLRIFAGQNSPHVGYSLTSQASNVFKQPSSNLFQTDFREVDDSSIILAGLTADTHWKNTSVKWVLGYAPSQQYHADLKSSLAYASGNIYLGEIESQVSLAVPTSGADYAVGFGTRMPIPKSQYASVFVELYDESQTKNKVLGLQLTPPSLFSISNLSLFVEVQQKKMPSQGVKSIELLSASTGVTYGGPEWRSYLFIAFDTPREDTRLSWSSAYHGADSWNVTFEALCQLKGCSSHQSTSNQKNHVQIKFNYVF